MEISRLDGIVLNLHILYKIMDSQQLTDIQKTEFILNNRLKIKEVMKSELNENDFLYLIENRKLEKFRPLKNSSTKWGDKLILAKALNIPVSALPQYIQNITETINDINKLNVPQSTMKLLKTYVFRHGNTKELVTFFDYELKTAKDKVKTLFHTLEYNTAGIADYFVRPIHKMSNKTLVSLFQVINNNLELAISNKEISPTEKENIAKIALTKLYNIQHNSKLINAIKTCKTIK